MKTNKAELNRPLQLGIPGNHLHAYIIQIPYSFIVPFIQVHIYSIMYNNPISFI